jgi:hypothetical protein
MDCLPLKRFAKPGLAVSLLPVLSRQMHEAVVEALPYIAELSMWKQFQAAGK